MSTLILASARGPKNARGNAGLVGNVEDCDLCLVLGIGDTAHNLLFHNLILVCHDRADVFQAVEPDGVHLVGRYETRQHPQPHAMHHGQLDRARLQNLRPQRCHFEHLFIGDLGQPVRLLHDARVSCVDAVDIGVDIADVGTNGDGDGDRAGVRTAPPQCRHPAGLRLDALEPGNDRDLAGFDLFAQGGAVDARNARRTVRGAGLDRDLPALPGARP